jgi:hypothetical protein
MTQDVGGHRFLYPRTCSCGTYHLMQRSSVVGKLGFLAGEQPCPRVASLRAPVASQNLQQLIRERHIAILAALALFDANAHGLLSMSVTFRCTASLALAPVS